MRRDQRVICEIQGLERPICSGERLQVMLHRHGRKPQREIAVGNPYEGDRLLFQGLLYQLRIRQPKRQVLPQVRMISRQGLLDEFCKPLLCPCSLWAVDRAVEDYEPPRHPKKFPQERRPMFMRDVFKGIVRSHEVEAGLDEGELLTRCENVAVMTEGDLFQVSEAWRRLGIRQDHFMSGEEDLQRAGSGPPRPAPSDVWRCPSRAEARSCASTRNAHNSRREGPRASALRLKESGGDATAVASVGPSSSASFFGRQALRGEIGCLTIPLGI